MSNLYIVGNGFDLHHDLKTSYSDFKKFLEKKEKCLFLKSLYDYFDSENLWSSFEEALGDIEIFKYINLYIPQIKSNSFFGKRISNEFIRYLRNYLYQWIRSIKIDIDIHGKKCLPINQNSIFLSFNYTNTLEILYNIDQSNIFYLHGKCTKDNNSSLIIGHNSDEIISFENYLIKYYGFDNDKKILELIDGYCKDYSIKKSKMKYIFMKLNDYQKKMKKNHSCQMKLNNIVFNEMKMYKRIIILGHSLGDVDSVYFNTIFNSCNDDTPIIVSYYDKKSLKKLKEQVRKYKIDKKVIYTEFKNIPFFD